MATKYYVDEDGNYMGGFDEGSPPEGGQEVSTPPDDGRQVWDFEEEEWLPLSDEILWAAVREERNARLAAIDWRVIRYKTQTDDLLTPDKDTLQEYQAVMAYMQALRDIPQDFATPDDVVWPTPPAP